MQIWDKQRTVWNAHWGFWKSVGSQLVEGWEHDKVSIPKGLNYGGDLIPLKAWIYSDFHVSPCLTHRFPSILKCRWTNLTHLQYNCFFITQRAALSCVMYRIFAWKDRRKKAAPLPLHAKFRTKTKMMEKDVLLCKPLFFDYRTVHHNSAYCHLVASSVSTFTLCMRRCTSTICAVIKIRLYAHGVCRCPWTPPMTKITSHGQCAVRHWL